MPQSVERDLLAPAVEDEPCNGRDAPPREVTEYDLQVDEQFADLHIQIADVEAQHKVEIICKEAYDDARKVEVERPEERPADNDPQMPLQKEKIAFDPSFYGLIRPPRQPFEDTKRQGIVVMFGIRPAVYRPHDDDEQQHTRQSNDKDFCHTFQNTSNLRPIPRKVLAADEQGEKLARSVGKAGKIGGQQDIPLHDGGVLRNRRRKGIVYAEQLTEVVRDGQPKIAARLPEAQIGLPEHRPEREKGKRDNDRNDDIPTHPPALPCRSDSR